MGSEKFVRHGWFVISQRLRREPNDFDRGHRPSQCNRALHARLASPGFCFCYTDFEIAVGQEGSWRRSQAWAAHFYGLKIRERFMPGTSSILAFQARRV